MSLPLSFTLLCGKLSSNFFHPFKKLLFLCSQLIHPLRKPLSEEKAKMEIPKNLSFSKLLANNEYIINIYISEVLLLLNPLIKATYMCVHVLHPWEHHVCAHGDNDTVNSKRDDTNEKKQQ